VPGHLGLGPNVFSTGNEPVLISRFDESHEDDDSYDDMFSTSSSSNAIKSTSDIKQIKQITVGASHCLVEAEDGTLYGFGSVRSCVFASKTESNLLITGFVHLSIEFKA